MQITASEKRMVNGDGSINQLAPLKYKWAWDAYQASFKNNWGPDAINMAQDVTDYRLSLNDAERHVYTMVLAYLSTADIAALRNVGVAVMEKITSPEVQTYLAMQIKEEAVHVATYQHCLETLNLDPIDIYNRYRTVPEIAAKIEYSRKMLRAATDKDIDLTEKSDLIAFCKSYIFFCAIFEGVWFYNGFSPVYSLQRRGLMKGTCEQFQYIQRDEMNHVINGMRIVKTIMEEEGVVVPADEIQAMFEETIRLETDYINMLLVNPILGYTADDHIEHSKFLCNRRAKKLGFKEPFPNAKMTLDWLDGQVNINKEKNFFETRVTEYQTVGVGEMFTGYVKKAVSDILNWRK